MTPYRFSGIVPSMRFTHDEILDVTYALGYAGCTDATIQGHTERMELLFKRKADSWQEAFGRV